MELRKIFLFLAVAVVCFLSGTYAGTRLSARPAAAPAQLHGFPVEIVNANEEEAHLYEIKVSYPYFPSLPESMNASVRSFVDAHVADFKKAARENMDARIATMSEEEKKTFVPEPFYLSVSWTPAQTTDRYVSFIIRTYAYEGGANGMDELATWNYDVKEKRDVTLRDLFPEEGDNYLQKLSKESRATLVGQLAFDAGRDTVIDMIEAGTEPTEENFKNFTFTDDAVTIYFEKYHVAPGSFGEQRVAIPRIIVR